LEELLFFIRGHTNAKLLSEKGVHIWDKNTSQEFLEKSGLKYQEGDMGPCFPLNTMVLTQRRGYVPIQDVNPTDLLYTHNGEWKKINTIHRRKYTGKLYTLYLEYGPMCVSATPEHPFLWTDKVGNKFQWREISKITNGYLVLYYDMEPNASTGGEYHLQLALFMSGCATVISDGHIERVDKKVIKIGYIVYYPITGHTFTAVNNVEVMNFEVDEHQSYTVENVAVHNCYGFQWRHFGAEYKDCHENYANQGIDQLANVIETIKTDPFNRRMIVSAWNPQQINEMVLPPCHNMFQFDVMLKDGKKYLNCLVNQRSADVPLGVPFNIASYALLTHIIAAMTGTIAGELIYVTGDTHIYVNQVEGCNEQLARVPYPFPTVDLSMAEGIKLEELTSDNFKLINYRYHPSIEIPFAT
jgi:thymidylate synthase